MSARTSLGSLSSVTNILGLTVIDRNAVMPRRVFVCMSVHVSKHISKHMYTLISTHTRRCVCLNTGPCTCTHVCTHVCTHACAHVCTLVYTHIHTHIYTYVCTHVLLKDDLAKLLLFESSKTPAGEMTSFDDVAERLPEVSLPGC